jgi:KDO2-lipid IV(A) lauroyltransferase
MSRVGEALASAALKPLAAVGRMPLKRAQRSTRWLAGPLRRLMRRRGEVVRRNLALCFPEASDAERRRIERNHFRNLAEAIGEISVAWHHPGRLDASFGEVRGLEHLEAAHGRDRGVLLLTGHVTCLELAARLVGERISARGMSTRGIYRPLRNAALERAQNRGRRRYADAMIPRKELRAMVRHLRSGGVLWYAPDQDLGPKRSRFAAFFGVPTATGTGLLDLARMGRAAVVPMFPVKDPETGRVCVTVEAALEPFPSDDPAADLTTFNAFLERHVRRSPSQYWWLHRRFKTAPPGTPDRYA